MLIKFYISAELGDEMYMKYIKETHKEFPVDSVVEMID